MKNNIKNHQIELENRDVYGYEDCIYPDSRYYRKDKPLVSLKSPSVTYPKQDIRLLEDL